MLILSNQLYISIKSTEILVRRIQLGESVYSTEYQVLSMECFLQCGILMVLNPVRWCTSISAKGYKIDFNISFLFKSDKVVPCERQKIVNVLGKVAVDLLTKHASVIRGADDYEIKHPWALRLFANIIFYFHFRFAILRYL